MYSKSLRLFKVMFTVACLGLAKFALVRLCLYWLVDHETMGGVNALRPDIIFVIIINYFLFCSTKFFGSGGGRQHLVGTCRVF